MDKPCKGPSECKNARRIALLSSVVKLFELILVRKILPIVAKHLSPGQYSYQGARSTEALLSDLDFFVTTKRELGRAVYIAGLDVAESFDRASHLKLAAAVRRNGALDIFTKFIGVWLPHRVSRERPCSPLGAVYRDYERGAARRGTIAASLAAAPQRGGGGGEKGTSQRN